MTWIESKSKRTVVIKSDLAAVRALLAEVVKCGKLMPGVELLEEVGDGVYHYRLEEFRDGAVTFKPDYETRFDLSNPAAITWEPHGEHNFRSWGAFRTEAGGVDGEVVLEIETRAEASVDIDPIMIPMVEPFANASSEEVTDGFLARIKQHIESSSAA